MHRRSPSVGSIVGDGTLELTAGRLPPRSPLSSAAGHRTPPACPTSPLLGGFAWAAGGTALTPVNAGTRSTGSTPHRARPRSVACHALPVVDLTHSRVLSNIVASVFESNLTAEQCFSTYGRMHTAPPLVGMSHSASGSRTHPAAAASAAAAGIIQAAPHAHSSTGLGLGGFGSIITDNNNDVDFGLATCLATPMDPGSGLKKERRLVQLPATTTAAARSATFKLTSANDILQETSRYGDWVRRQGRRRKLERMQGLLAELGANAVLGRLVDDTLLDTDPALRHRRKAGGRDEKDAADRGIMDDGADGGGLRLHPGAAAAGEGAAAAEEELGSEGSGESDDEEEEEGEFPARYEWFRDDMALMR